MIKLINIYDDEWGFDDPLIDLSAHEQLDSAIDFWHTGKIDKAEKIFQSILHGNTCHIDAYHHLSMLYDDSSRQFEAYLCCREAVRIGLSVIPAEFSWANSKLTWGNLIIAHF